MIAIHYCMAREISTKFNILDAPSLRRFVTYDKAVPNEQASTYLRLRSKTDKEANLNILTTPFC